MKKKLLFIGNSHIGSLKSGFEYIDKRVLTNYELSFCGVRRNHFYKHKLIGDILEFDKSVTRFNFNLQDHIKLFVFLIFLPWLDLSIKITLFTQIIC